MADAQIYSTLEVSARQSRNDAPGLEVDHSRGIGTWNAEGRYLQPNTNVDYKSEGYSYELAEGQQLNQDSPTTPETKRKNIICGISRRLFIAALVVSLLVVIGAIVGSVAGVLLSRKNSTPDATRNILKTSWLAAANRTVGENSLEQRTVFFQDGSGALIARYLLEPSLEWETINLTQFFEPTKDDKVRLPHGAPLAAVACRAWGCGDTRLFYLATDGTIHDLNDNSEKGGGGLWKSNGYATKARLRPSPGSQLAVTLTQRFDENAGGQNSSVNRLLAYQGLDGSVYVANDSSQYRMPQRLGDGLPNQANNTSLAMITQLRGDWLDQVSLVANGTDTASAFNSGFTMIEAIYAEKDDAWNQGANILDTIPQTQTQEPSSVTTGQFATTMRNNWEDSIYLALLSDGSITGRILGHHDDTMKNIRLGDSRELPRFSAIATTMNGYLYGVVDDTIREYTFDTSDPSIIHFEGIVYNETVKGG